MKTVGNYEIIEKIGEGGMAVVYKGIQRSLNRHVAIKVLSDKMTQDPEIVERFNRESLIIARLTHPNIIHVIDRGITDEGMHYFVMDFLEGPNLAHWIQNGHGGFNKNLDIMIQVCKALSYAHKSGVIHRDIKPSNILIDGEENAMVSDFGIAQLYDQTGNGEPLTREGIIMGTLAYMSPEQKVESRNLTASTDLFSLGVIMYELFTQTKPLGHFKAPSQMNPELPKSLDDIILKCLEPEPEQRYLSADELKDRLLEVLQGGHIGKVKKEEALQGFAKGSERFSLLDIIRENEYGGVYLFQDKMDGQLLVIKKPNREKQGLTEARLLTTLKHKNIINIYGVSENTKFYIIVMEYMSGGSLKDRLIKPHPWKEVLKTGREVCEGLSFAHKNRILHGNLRPSNILISGAGEVKISDFGLNEHYVLEKGKSNWYGLPGEGKSVHTDIYAAGTILYELLTGTPPHWENKRLVPHQAFHSAPRAFQRILTRMVTPERDQRFNGFEEIIEEINQLESYAGTGEWHSTHQTGKSKKRGRVLLVAVMFMIVGMVSFGIYFYGEQLQRFFQKHLSSVQQSLL